MKKCCIIRTYANPKYQNRELRKKKRKKKKNNYRKYKKRTTTKQIRFDFEYSILKITKLNYTCINIYTMTETSTKYKTAITITKVITKVCKIQI